MDDILFNELLESAKQMQEIIKGIRKPSRQYIVEKTMVDLYTHKLEDAVGHRIYPFDFVVFPVISVLAFGIVLTGIENGIIILQITVDGEHGKLLKLRNLKNVFCVYSQVINNKPMLKARMYVIDNWSELCKTF